MIVEEKELEALVDVMEDPAEQNLCDSCA